MDTSELDSGFDPLSVDDTVGVGDGKDDTEHMTAHGIDPGSCIYHISQIGDIHSDHSNGSHGLSIPETDSGQHMLDILLSRDTSADDLDKTGDIKMEGETTEEQLQAAVSEQTDPTHIIGQIHAVRLLDGRTAFIEQKEGGESLSHGDSVVLEDGSTAYIDAGIKDGLQAVQLQGGITAFISTADGDLITDGSLPFTHNTNDPTNLQNTIPIRAFGCMVPGCGKFYTTQHHLKVHLRSHSGDRPFKCTVEGCNKTFASGYGLKSHIRTHTGEKPYRCSHGHCEKGFKTSGDLQKHVRTHTGERPFKCPFEDCDRAFTTSNIRKVHIRTHTGERPYLCEQEGCGRSFASATNYKNHVRIHSGEKPYVCSVVGCEKRFTEYSSLYKHHVVHTHAKPYTCPTCNKTYRQTSTLAMHRRHAHSELYEEVHGRDLDTEPEAKKLCLVTPVLDHLSETGDNNLIINTDPPQNILVQPGVGDSVMTLPTSGLMTMQGTQQIIVVADASQLEAIQHLTKQTQIVDLRTMAPNSILTLTPISKSTDIPDESEHNIVTSTRP